MSDERCMISEFLPVVDRYIRPTGMDRETETVLCGSTWRPPHGECTIKPTGTCRVAA